LTIDVFAISRILLSELLFSTQHNPDIELQFGGYL